ncbi:MAG TPA: redoxin domain-containing protein, partial [Dehalococcoidia bacterium]
MASPFTGLPAGGFRVDSRERIRRLLHTADPQLSVIPLVEETVRGAHESVDNPQDVYVDERGLRVEGLKAFSDDYDIGYDLLSDEGSAVIREFGILNTIIDPNDPRAERFNGLPFPGTYVVDGEGVVTEKFFNRHYGTRTSAGTILDSALGRVLRHEEAPEAAYSDERAVVTAFMSGPTLTLEVTNTLYVRIEMAEGLHIYGEPLP